jgi:hypothetical protein
MNEPSYDNERPEINVSVLATKRGNVQLWQFLLRLLNSPNHKTIIEWTRRCYAEFKLLDPEEVFLFVY